MSDKHQVCLNCKYLYVKDFITGTCDNGNSDKGVVKPDDSCKHWEDKPERRGEDE